MDPLGDLRPAVASALEALASADAVARLWKRDHTLWRPDAAEISDRLGWLDAPAAARPRLSGYRALAERVAADGLTHAVLLGMGGSSLAPEVLRHVLGVAPGMVDLSVLDSTHPAAVTAVEDAVPLDRTLFVVASKSGTTIETRSHLERFWSLVRNGRQFLAITDPGSPLEARAGELGFREVIHAAPDVGGRYSALTAFGLVPAALIGADLDALVEEAADEADACGPGTDPRDNPGAVLGAAMGAAARAGRDKLTLRFPGRAAPFGAWVEQLVAESTGKDGVGILPVDGEPPDGSGDDRLFVGVGQVPAPGLSVGDDLHLGPAFFRFEVATALAGAILGIHPFDQPDVQAAKDSTAAVLASGHVPDEPEGDLDRLLARVRPGDYVAMQAFVPPLPERLAELQA
ncbi:MAG: hypothetical protein M3245_05215, partial [Actinomycetota bacterium]|nr:hypothetical protein [Actinomycetota bacterium]